MPTIAKRLQQEAAIHAADATLTPPAPPCPESGYLLPKTSATAPAGSGNTYYDLAAEAQRAIAHFGITDLTDANIQHRRGRQARRLLDRARARDRGGDHRSGRRGCRERWPHRHPDV
jgi:hypothetical protein